MRLLFIVLGLFLFEFVPTWHLSVNPFRYITHGERQRGSDLGGGTTTRTESLVIDGDDVKSSSGESTYDCHECKCNRKWLWIIEEMSPFSEIVCAIPDTVRQFSAMLGHYFVAQWIIE